MASPTIEKREKIINKIIAKKYDKSYKISSCQYAKSINRDQIINQKKEMYLEFYSNTILPNGICTSEIDKELKSLELTERFFGFKLFDNYFDLLWKLHCIDYEEGKTKKKFTHECKSLDENEFIQCIEDKMSEFENIPYMKNPFTDSSYIDIVSKYNDWKIYCKEVDEIENFIKKNIPNFSKLKIEDKNHKIRELKENIFTKSIGNYLTDYTLKEQKKAKIDKLLSLELPNLNNINIVTMFVDAYIKYQTYQTITKQKKQDLLLSPFKKF